MIRSLFGEGTVPAMLRGGLEEQSATSRLIGDRVARATQVSSSDDFDSAMAATARARATGESLEQDMAALADTQLRYEATTKLLTQAYAQFRTAMNDRG